jgi:hypothetical protein
MFIGPRNERAGYALAHPDFLKQKNLLVCVSFEVTIFKRGLVVILQMFG